MAGLAWTTTARWRPSWRRSTRSSGSSPPPTAMSSSPTSTASARPSSAGRPPRWRSVIETFGAAGINAIADAGQPRVPHLDRRAGQRAAARRAAPAGRARRRDAADRRQRQRGVLPDGRRRRTRCIELLGRQVASPVQFVKGLQTLYDGGCARVRRGRSEEGAARLRRGRPRRARRRRRACSPTTPSSATCRRSTRRCAACTRPGSASRRGAVAASARSRTDDPAQPTRPACDRSVPSRRRTTRLRRARLGRDRRHHRARPRAARRRSGADGRRPASRWSSPVPRSACPAPTRLRRRQRRPDPRRQQFIDAIPHAAAPAHARQEHHPAGQARGRASPAFETIDDEAEVIKLAGRAGALDLVAEFGIDAGA